MICIPCNHADPGDTPDGCSSKAHVPAMHIPAESLSSYPYSENKSLKYLTNFSILFSFQWDFDVCFALFHAYL